MVDSPSVISEASQSGVSRATGARRLVLLLAPILVASFAMTFDPGLVPIEPGLDRSYTYAFNRAIAEGRLFGQDFISTYGPLGFLIAAHDAGPISDRRLAAEWVRTAILAVVVVAFTLSLRLGGTWQFLLAALLLVNVLAAQSREYQCLGVLVIALLAALRNDGRRAVIGAGGLGVLAGTFLLVKGSLGFGCLVTLAAGQLWWARRRDWWPLVASTGGTAASLAVWWSLTSGGLAGLGHWLHTAWLLAGEYSAAMSLTLPGMLGVAVRFAVFTLGLVLYAALQPRWRTIGTLLACAAPLFVLWKHVIVRPANQRRSVLVLFGLFLAVVVVLDSLPLKRRIASLAIPTAAAVVLASAWSGFYSRPDEPLWRHLMRPWLCPGLQWVPKLVHFQEYRSQTAMLSAERLKSLALPLEDRKALKGRTLEPYPWELAYLAANPGQDWILRPSPASFGTYVEELDRGNADYFRGPRRPEYVVWHRPDASSIDGRHLFWDEPLTLRSLVDGYDLASRRDDFLLLRSRARSRFIDSRELGEQSLQAGQTLPAPKTAGPLLAEIRVASSPARLVWRVVYREDPLALVVRFASGQERLLRFVPGTSGSGLWINPLPGDADELARVFSGQPATDSVVSLTLQPAWMWRFSAAPRLRWRELIPYSK